MESIPEEWFSIQTVKELGGVAAVFYLLGGWSLAFAIRRKWIALGGNMKNAIDLAVCIEKVAERDKKIANRDEEIAGLRAEIERLRGKL